MNGMNDIFALTRTLQGKEMNSL